MKRVYFLHILLIAFYLAQSCKSNKPANIPIAASVDTTHIDTESVSISIDTINYLHLFLDSIQLGKENNLVGEDIHAENALHEFYSMHDHQLVWRDSLKSDEAIRQIIMAWKEGLNPKDYHLESLLDLNSYLGSKPTDRESEAIFDILLSDGLMVYADHLTQGKLDPESLYPSWNFFTRNLANDAMEQFNTAISADSIGEYFEQLSPQTKGYSTLREGVMNYTNIIYMGGWDSLPILKTIHPYDSTFLAPMLRERLIVEGFEIEYDSSLVYDDKLIEQIKLFQMQSGLIDDGVIGKHSINALNESATSKLNKIKVNMERSRWVLEGELNEFIIVNIARYQMYYSDSGQVTYTSKVMVGKDEKQTPVFRDNMEYVVFNPTWTLPQSISSTETLPKLQRDSLYMQKNNMVIINAKGEVQSDSGLVWSDYTEDYFPFIIRQEPGPKNALGRVKFLFPNKYAIYLHDTPSRYLFAKEERAFSHGCIRLQNPLDFSEFLLSKQDTNWTMDSIRTVLDSAQTMSVRLKKKIPVYLMYWTAGINEDGRLFFVPDIYGRDERILRALGKND